MTKKADKLLFLPNGLFTAGLSAMLAAKLEREMAKPRNEVSITIRWGLDDD